jgi:hypothetical protein
MTSLTPCRPLRATLLRKLDQRVSASDRLMCSPTISRRPSVLAATAMFAATAAMPRKNGPHRLGGLLRQSVFGRSMRWPNLGNFMRTLAMPKPVERWSMTNLREKLIKIGAKVVSHAGAGSRAISDRISANSRRGTATSAS